MMLFAHAASLPGGIPIRSAENWPCSSAMKTSLKSASVGERLVGSPQSIHVKKPLWPRSPPSGGPGIGCSRTSVFWMVQRFVWPSIVVSRLRALKAEKHPSKSESSTTPPFRWSFSTQSSRMYESHTSLMRKPPAPPRGRIPSPTRLSSGGSATPLPQTVVVVTEADVVVVVTGGCVLVVVTGGGVVVEVLVGASSTSTSTAGGPDLPSREL